LIYLFLIPSKFQSLREVIFENKICHFTRVKMVSGAI
jgi:hypothetical protein